jgi:hypothetical protein
MIMLKHAQHIAYNHVNYSVTDIAITTDYMLNIYGCNGSIDLA